MTDEMPTDVEAAQVAEEEKPEAKTTKRKSLGLDPAPVISGPRQRKKAEHYQVEVKEKAEFVIKPGKGTKLGEIPNVHYLLGKLKTDDDLLTGLHSLLFKRPGTANRRKKNLFEFSGLTFDEGDKDKELEKTQEKLSKWTIALLNSALDVFELPRGNGDEGKKEAKVERLLKFLEEPKKLSEKDLATEAAKKKEKEKAKKEREQKAKTPKSAAKTGKKAETGKESAKKRAKEESEDEGADEESEEQEEDAEVEEPPKKRARKDVGTAEKKPAEKKRAEKKTSQGKKSSAKKSKADDEMEDEEELAERLKEKLAELEEKLAEVIEGEDEGENEVESKDEIEGESKEEIERESKVGEEVEAAAAAEDVPDPAWELPTDEEVTEATLAELEVLDVNTTTVKDLLKMLKAKFGKDLSSKKALVKKVAIAYAKEKPAPCGAETGEDQSDAKADAAPKADQVEAADAEEAAKEGEAAAVEEKPMEDKAEAAEPMDVEAPKDEAASAEAQAPKDEEPKKDESKEPPSEAKKGDENEMETDEKKAEATAPKEDEVPKDEAAGPSKE